MYRLSASSLSPRVMLLHNCAEQLHQCAQCVLALNVFFSETVHSHTLYLIKKKTPSRDQKICKFEHPPHYALNFGIPIKQYQKTRIKNTKQRRFPSSQLRSRRDNKTSSLGALFLSLDRLKVALSFFLLLGKERFTRKPLFLWMRSTFAP